MAKKDSRSKRSKRSKPAPDPQVAQSSPTTPLGRLWDTLRARSPSPSRTRGSNTPDQLDVRSALPAHNPMVRLGGHGSPSSSTSGAPIVPISNPPSPSYGVVRRNSTPDQPTQSLAVHSSYSDSSALQTQRPPLHALSSPTDAGGSPTTRAQGSSTISVSAPIVQTSHSQSESIASENPAPSSIYGSNIPTSSCQAQASAEIVVQAAAAPQTKSASQVWAKTLELAGKKLKDNNLPALNPTNFTSQSAEKNIEAVIKALNTLQEDERKKRWSYTWNGKEVVVVERLRKIMKNVEQYKKVVDIAIQANPQVSALVWAGVCGIMRVVLNHIEVIEGFEVAMFCPIERCVPPTCGTSHTPVGR
ncbi:hypothetical protein BGX38DRAFT_1278593 [Terfezia claveryi]|nr:hypothetical protein BGX38DRAFT_1278593 [Terfezia claveryi]